MKILKYLLSCVFILLGGHLLAQSTIRISGVVAERSTKEPIIGVTVVDKNNKSNGTVTDLDGKYSISVPANATLIFSSLGYEPVEVSVDGKTIIDVTMDDNMQELETVVVVGAVMRKSDLTGAVGTIDAKKLEELPVTSINQALQGRLAGVYVQTNAGVGGNASIKIRGNNSIQFGTNPIYVVDGIIMDGGFNLVDVSDVASIEVLKDASATALYGSLAANGVVVVTTKKGKSGEAKISYDGWVGFSEFSKKFSLMNAKQMYDLRLDAYANGDPYRADGYTASHPGATRQELLNVFSTPGSGYEIFGDYEFDAYRDGRSYNWMDKVTRKGLQHNHSVSFSGGSEKSSYYVSFGYFDQEGLVKNSDFKRYSGKINLDQSLKKWLRIGTNTSFARSEEGLVEGNVFNTAVGANPFLSTDTDETYMFWGAIEQRGTNNPIKSLTIDGDRYQNRLTSANYMNINPIEDLNLRATFSIDAMNQQEYWYIPKNVGQSMHNSYEGEASQRKDEWLYWQWDLSAAYNFTIADKHKISALATFNAKKNDWSYNQQKGRGFVTDKFSYYYMEGATNRDLFELKSDFQTSTLVGCVQRLNYNYDKKYYATLTLREEASSKFMPDERWGLFPALALSWNISEENFMKNLEFLDMWKLRAGYGIVGNQNIPLYSVYSLYRPSATSDGNVNYNSDGRLGNPDLTWEKQKQLNIGMDFTFFGDRLSLIADYYYILNSDLLMQRNVSGMFGGFTNTIANVGELENKGFEFTVNGKIIDNKELQWAVSGNISFNKNKIKKLYGDVDVLWNKGGWTGTEIQRTGNLFVGKSLNSIYVYQFDKIVQEEDRGKYDSEKYGGRIVDPGDIVVVDRNDDKVISDADRYVVGNTDPKFYGGFSTDVSYKGLKLNAVFNYAYGAKKVGSTYEYLMASGGMSAAHTDMLKRWTPENPSTRIPRAMYGANHYSVGDTDLGIQNASFLRMAALTLSYDLPKTWLNTVKLDNLQVYFTGNNLFTITKYKGYDPEGGDYYPSTRMYVMGMRFSF